MDIDMRELTNYRRKLCKKQTYSFQQLWYVNTTANHEMPNTLLIVPRMPWICLAKIKSHVTLKYLELLIGLS
jgi:hypothetical protein